jgi:hypothetical protein
MILRGVVGLDLSLRSTAACYLPPSWSPAAPRFGIQFGTFGSKVERGDFEGRARRLAEIAEGVGDFVGTIFARRPSRDLAVAVEEYAYAAGAKSGVMLGELGGAVKAELWRRFGVAAFPMATSRARIYLLGKLPRGKGTQGPAVQAAAARLGLAFPTSDPVDAFVVANAMRAELGMPGCTLG